MNRYPEFVEFKTINRINDTGEDIRSIELVIDEPSCILIGNTSLLMKCCDILLRKNWVILGIISSDSGVIDYAIFSIFKTLNFKYFTNSMRRIKFEVTENIFVMKGAIHLQNPEQTDVYNENVNIKEIKRTNDRQNPGQTNVLDENAKIISHLVRNYYPEIYYGNLFLIQCKSETEGERVNKTRTNFFGTYVAGEIIKKQINTAHFNMFNYPYVEEVTDMINSFLLSNSESWWKTGASDHPI